MFNVIPAIDILDGQVVRLTQGNYNDVDHYPIGPVELAQKLERHGAKRIHLVDLNGARKGSIVNLEVFQRIRRNVNCQLQLGGGIRSQDTIEALFSVGIDFLVLGSILVQNKSLAKSLVEKYPEKLIAGIDTKQNKIATNGWESTSDMDLSELLSELDDWPIQSIIYTSIEQDGMMSGPNIHALREFASKTQKPVIASGGVQSNNDINQLKRLNDIGISGCIIGKAFLTGHLPMSALKL